MRLLLAAHTFWPEMNGVAEVVRQIATRLSARGHDVHVATRRRRGLPAMERVAGVGVARFDVEGNWRTGVRGEVERYRAFVENESWDAIEIHCAQSWPLDSLLERISRIRARRIFVGHGLSEFGNPAWAGYFDLLARVLPDFDRVVALSDLLEESDLCHKVGMRCPTVVPNAVDLEEWNGPARGVRERWRVRGGPWLVSVSNHSPVKGHDAFFDVIQRVGRAIPAAAATIVGGPYPAERWGLGRLGVSGGCWYACHAKSLWFPRVGLRANVPRPEVVSAIMEADVVLVTSSREAAPLVILEAQAAGTPWVAFNVGCVRENPGGMVAGSPREMAEMAMELIRSPDKAAELAAEGRRATVARGGWERIAILHERLCRGEEP